MVLAGRGRAGGQAGRRAGGQAGRRAGGQVPTGGGWRIRPTARRPVSAAARPEEKSRSGALRRRIDVTRRGGHQRGTRHELTSHQPGGGGSDGSPAVIVTVTVTVTVTVKTEGPPTPDRTFVKSGTKTGRAAGSDRQQPATSNACL